MLVGKNTNENSGGVSWGCLAGLGCKVLCISDPPLPLVVHHWNVGPLVFGATREPFIRGTLSLGPQELPAADSDTPPPPPPSPSASILFSFIFPLVSPSKCPFLLLFCFFSSLSLLKYSLPFSSSLTSSSLISCSIIIYFSSNSWFPFLVFSLRLYLFVQMLLVRFLLFSLFLSP